MSEEADGTRGSRGDLASAGSPTETAAAESASSPRDLLEYLARGLVDEPAEVSVREVREDDGSVVLELSVGRDDYGNVIGRGGRTASALRTVVKGAAAKHGGGRVFVDIVDS